MDTFWKSLRLSFSVGACLFAPFMALSCFMANFTATSELARSISKVALVLAFPVLLVGIVGLIASRRSDPFFPVAPSAPISRLAIASIVLSFSGFCTMGLGSLVGIVIGILALRTICLRREQRGQKLAVAGISIGCGFIALLSSLLFLGP